jgi:hypothetical protein
LGIYAEEGKGKTNRVFSLRCQISDILYDKSKKSNYQDSF